MGTLVVWTSQRWSLSTGFRSSLFCVTAQKLCFSSTTLSFPVLSSWPRLALSTLMAPGLTSLLLHFSSAFEARRALGSGQPPTVLRESLRSVVRAQHCSHTRDNIVTLAVSQPRNHDIERTLPSTSSRNQTDQCHGWRQDLGQWSTTPCPGPSRSAEPMTPAPLIPMINDFPIYNLSLCRPLRRRVFEHELTCDSRGAPVSLKINLCCLGWNSYLHLIGLWCPQVSKPLWFSSIIKEEPV